MNAAISQFLVFWSILELIKISRVLLYGSLRHGLRESMTRQVNASGPLQSVTKVTKIEWGINVRWTSLNLRALRACDTDFVGVPSPPQPTHPPTPCIPAGIMPVTLPLSVCWSNSIIIKKSRILKSRGISKKCDVSPPWGRYLKAALIWKLALLNQGMTRQVNASGPNQSVTKVTKIEWGIIILLFFILCYCCCVYK